MYLDAEIREMKVRGFALAAVYKQCRVYRGNGSVFREGGPLLEDELKCFSRLDDLIRSVKGHIGHQTLKARPGRRVGPSAAYEAAKKEVGK